MIYDDLMYCDLVYRKGIPHKVGVCGDCFRIVDAEGIPVTPEILEKNGFHLILSSIDENVYYGNDECAWLFLSIGREKEILYVKNLRSKRHLEFEFRDTLYVHELQHILRLCGLNELADNFKL